MVRFIFDQFDSFQNQIAMVDGLSERECSFAEMRDSTAKLSSGLRRMGLQKGDVIALCSPNSIDYPNMFLATLAGGGIVSTCNPGFTAGELNYQFKNSRAKYVATIPALMSTVNQAIKNTGVEKIIIMGSEDQKSFSDFVSFETLLKDSGSLFEVEPVNCKEEIAVLPYSSGTTGLPKRCYVNT